MDNAVYAGHCRTVAGTFAAAFPGFVVARLAARVPDPHMLDAAIVAAQRDLQTALLRWADTPPHRQDASPLELFREAMAGPTEAAVELGAKPVERSDVETAALPGDVLGIAPATSQDLGEAAWKAHVAWGLARAEAVAGVVPRPGPAPAGTRVALFGSNLMDRTRIAEAVADAGYELLVWRNPAAVADGLAGGLPDLVLVDLAHPAAMDAIRSLAASGARIIAYGPHVDDQLMAAAQALGADEVLPRSRFFRRLPSLLPTPL